MQDAQGNELTGGNAEAAAHLDRGVKAFALSYGDAMGAIEAAREAAPGCAMAHIVRAWVAALANDAIMVRGAAPLMETASGLPLDDRERAHLEALRHAILGHRSAAVAVLERHLLVYPRDVMAHYAAMILDAFNGRFHRERDRAARALPFWSKDDPGYGTLLSFYGFGLEESGEYTKAEEISRQAAMLEPHGYWPHHAVSHVMEMTGRPADGLSWMAERQPLWSAKENTSRVHIWWHKALFHVELGQYDEAVAIYDGPVVETQRPVGLSLTNATALLWRLECLGYDGGSRWEKLADIWEGHADGRLCLFADLHALMTALRAGRHSEADSILAGMRETAAETGGAGMAYREAGLPIAAGIAAFHRGAYGEAVDHLLAARAALPMIGGSHAQRDLIDWTLIEAANRAGLRNVALSLAYERLALRPGSAPNRRFKAVAEMLAA